MNNDDFCGECSLCCTWVDNATRPSLEEDELTSFHYEYLEDGRHAIAVKQGTGECYYLEDGKCSIHTFSPKACQEFDCRVLLRDIQPDVIHTSLIIAEGFKRASKS